MNGKWLTALQAILIALVILAGSIAAPILCRPFYYLHIEPLKLQGAADLTTDQIKTAYNEMMNEARAIATKRMVAEAEELGADAMVMVMFSNVVPGAAYARIEL